MYKEKRNIQRKRKTICNLTKIAGKILLRYTVAEIAKKVYYIISYLKVTPIILRRLLWQVYS